MTDLPKSTNRRGPKLVFGILALLTLVSLVLWIRALGKPAPEEAPSAAPSQTRTPPLPTRMSSGGPSPSIEPTEPEAVSGYLVDAEGKPVSGASVSLLGHAGEELETSEPSSASGAFFLPSFEDLNAELAEALPLRIRGAEILDATARVQSMLVPPRIMVQRRTQILVSIADSAGVQSPSCTVHLLSGADEQGQSADCDDKGQVHFDALPPGNYQLWASNGVETSALTTLESYAEDEQREPFPILLAPATRLSGRVKSSSGLGVEATLRLVPEGHEHVSFLAHSEPGGGFVLPALPRGRWSLRAESSTHSLARPIQLEASEPELYRDIPMIARGSIRGTVVDANGAGIEGAHLRFTRLFQGPATSSSSDLKVSDRLHWVHPLAGKRFLPIRDTRRFGARRDGVRPAECGAGHCGVDIGGTRGWPVLAAADGRVLVALNDDRGKSGRYVAIEHMGGFKSFYMHLDSVDEDIRVGQVVRAGTVLGTLGRSGVQRSEAHLHFALSKQEAEHSYFINPEPMLRFAQVLPVPPEKLDDVEGLVLAQSGDTHSPMSVESQAPPLTGSDGSFYREGLEAGRYLVTVLHPDKAPGKSRQINLRPGQSIESLRIVLRDGVRLRGKVLGASGPLADAWVRVSQGEGESRRVITSAGADPDGQFELRPLEGKVELDVGAAGYGVITKAIQLGQWRNRELLIELPSFDSQLRGQLRDPTGSPLGGGQARIVSGPAGRGRRASCDEYGFFLFDKVPAGSYRIKLMAEGYPESEVSIETGSEPSFEMPRGGGLRVELRDAHSQAGLVGLRIDLEGPKGARTTLLSNEAGRAAFTALVPGRWSLTIDSPDHVAVEKFITIQAEDGPNPRGEELVLDLNQGARLAGVLLDAAGERVAGARIWVGAVEAETDRDGRFDLRQVAPGKVVLRATKAGASAERALELYAGDELVTLDLRFEKAAPADQSDEDEETEETEESPEE